MDVVCEGRLTDEVQLKNVLLKILEKRPSGNLLLRIATTERDCDGKICIVDGRFITAAIIGNTHENGYPAVRRLLSIEHGNFACLRPSPDDSLSIPYSLNIELEKVIPLVPNLPESANGLHDEKSLLDKVFGSNAFDPIEPKSEIVDSKPQNPNASWQLLQPLVAPNAVVEPLVPVVPVRVIEPISADELASLSMPRTIQDDSDTKIKPGKRNTGGISPMIIVSAVGLLLFMELLAIAFWKPLSLYLSQQIGDRAAATTAHRPAKIKSTQKH
ncbi:hypothetical protein BH10CYA1_BH10CYA1_16470 [soil metagenome]